MRTSTLWTICAAGSIGVPYVVLAVYYTAGIDAATVPFWTYALHGVNTAAFTYFAMSARAAEGT